MMQHFPEYVRTMTYSDALGSTTPYDPQWTENDSTNKANSWAALGGLRFNYKVSPKVTLFAHVDYVQTFGREFGNKPSQFTVRNSVEILPVDETTFVKSFLDHYEERQATNKTLHKTIQAGIGVKMMFGGQSTPVVPLVKEEPVKYDDLPKPVAAAKDLQIVVKDKQTNLALSGVTVSVIGDDREEKSLSDASGQATKIAGIKPGRYQIVAGERRWRAAQLAALTTVPVIERQLDDLEVLEVALVENVQREDLNPVEEARAYSTLMERFGHTQEGLSRVVGKSRSHVANTTRLLSLPEPVLDHLAAGRLSAGHARALVTAAEPVALAEKIVADGLNVRQAEKLAKGGADGAGRGKSRGGETTTPDSLALQQDLADALGLKVELKDRGGRGELVIRYATLEQLDDLCSRLMRGA